MDIHMQPVNGIEATRTIRQFAPEIKIIGVSVQAERSYVNEMLRNGANGYVTKNSSSQEMILAIAEVVAGRNQYVGEGGDPCAAPRGGCQGAFAVLLRNRSVY